MRVAPLTTLGDWPALKSAHQIAAIAYYLVALVSDYTAEGQRCNVSARGLPRRGTAPAARPSFCPPRRDLTGSVAHATQQSQSRL